MPGHFVSSRHKRDRWIAAVCFAAAALFVYRHLLAGHVFVARDIYRLLIPETAYLRERLLDGELPLWISRVRLGQPFAATLYTQVFYLPRLAVAVLFEPVLAANVLILFHALWAAAGAYWCARRLRVDRLSAIAAGAFGFTPFFTYLSEAEHAASALSWTGWIFGAAIGLARFGRLRDAALVAAGLGMSCLAGCPELLVWQGAGALAVAGWLGTRRSAALGAAASLWAVALGAVILIPGLELIRQLTKEPASDSLAWSTSPAQLVSMAWLFAEEKMDVYWGKDQWFVRTLFVGALMCTLALVSFRVRRARPFLALAAVCALLSLGRHFFLSRWILSIPPLDAFRYPVKYGLGATFGIAIAASLGLAQLRVWGRRRRASVPLAALVLAGSVLAIGGIAALVGVLPVRQGMQPGWFWYGCWVGAAAVAFLLVPRRRVVLALACLELVAANVLKRPATLDRALMTKPSSLAAKLKADGIQRATIEAEGETPATEQQVAPDFDFVAASREELVPLRFLEEGLSSVTGYGFREPWRLNAALEDWPQGTLEVFGVTHVVQPHWYQITGLEEVARARWSVAYRFPWAYPRAFVVHQAAQATDEEALAALRAGGKRLREEVLLAEGAPGERGPSAQAGCTSSATLTTTREELLEIAVKSCAEGWLVLTDSHFPGWRATVDGASTEIHRANYLLRAVQVPAGDHTVRFVYRPMSVYVGGAISAIAWLLVAAAIIRRRSR